MNHQYFLMTSAIYSHHTSFRVTKHVYEYYDSGMAVALAKDERRRIHHQQLGLKDKRFQYWVRYQILICVLSYFNLRILTKTQSSSLSHLHRHTSTADAHDKANAVVVAPVVHKPTIRVLDVGSSYNPYRTVMLLYIPCVVVVVCISDPAICVNVHKLIIYSAIYLQVLFCQRLFLFHLKYIF